MATDSDGKNAGNKNDSSLLMTLLMTVFGVMFALNMSEETKIESFSQMPISMEMADFSAFK